jgi:Rps23 Pro-64 3,4-dihydroxylase Tpa1-like proline 4-hydroxylase
MHTLEELHLSSIETFSQPFPYLVSPEAFSKDASLEILNWLETDAPWRLVETNFYEQYEFSLAEVRLPAHLAFLQDRNFLNRLKARIEGLFQARLSEQIDLTAHKLISGQRIRIHNDFIPGQETHRLLIQLNRHWTEADGGFLLLFNSSDPADVHKVFRPFHNSVVGMVITPVSHHAVSLVHGGERFTLVYSFYSDER